MENLKIIIADDHDIVRFGISSVLQGEEDIDVVGEASDGSSTIDLYRKLKPDVALIDITMPGKDGIETTKDLLKEFPDAKILMLTMHMDEEYLSKSIKAGALGYLLKNCEKKELLEGVRAAAEGKKVFSTAISRLITESYVSNIKEGHENKSVPKKSAHLTKREQEILGLIAEGLTSQEIASKLVISPRTVETHRANLLQKLDIKNTAGLVRYAIENGHLNS